MSNDETLNDSWNVVSKTTSKTTETFHSMSEIASCNYEARKVRRFEKNVDNKIKAPII
jgi:hypothetical protein